MSEKEKKDLPESEEVREESPKPAEEQQPAEETFTVTREQMEKTEALARMVSDGNDKYLRLAAEYDNYRKRTAKEKENLYATAKADTIRPFLDVYDNLERGLAQFAEDDPHRQGLEMITKQLLDVLAKLGVTEIEALGVPFDPEKHNAVMHVEDESAGENTVVEVFQKGFALGDKVLRFSVVKVAN
jgi:molecular chaperone GrpE